MTCLTHHPLRLTWCGLGGIGPLILAFCSAPAVTIVRLLGVRPLPTAKKNLCSPLADRPGEQGALRAGL